MREMVDFFCHEFCPKLITNEGTKEDFV